MADPATNSYDDVIEALQLTAAALQCVAPSIPNGERHIITFTGDWLHISPRSIRSILDKANAALEPYSKERV